MQVRLLFFFLCSWFLLISIKAAAQAGSPSRYSNVNNETCGQPSCVWSVFGPQTYQRQAGEPRIVHSQFSVLNSRAVYTLRLQGSEAANPEIRLNGRKILDRDDFRDVQKGCRPDADGPAASCSHNGVVTIAKRVALESFNTLEVEERGLPRDGFTLSILGVDAGFPGIAATVTPPPNSLGWNNSPVTVAFTCSDTTSGIASCPSPVSISGEGLNQPVSGVALDRAGNSASVHLQVSIDSTPPIINLLHPANGQTVASSTVNVNGALRDGGDGLSGIDPASVTCNGLPAFSTAAGFACNVSLASGANLVVAQARDRAGNLASGSLSVVSAVAPVPAPSAIFFTPPMMTMLARQTHTAGLLGDQGQAIHGATLASSDPKVVAVSGDGPFTLQSIAPGNATIIASLNELKATLQVMVLPGKEFPSGTRLFSVTPQPGDDLVQIFSSDASSNPPGANGPAFFAVDATPAGDILRAINGDGAQMWSTPLGLALASQLAAVHKLGRAMQVETQNPMLQRWLDIEARQKARGGAAPVTRAMLRILRPPVRQPLPPRLPRPASHPASAALNGAFSGPETSIEAVVADEAGGVITLIDAGSQGSLLRLDSQTGQLGWEYDSPGGIDPQIAISPEGVVYFLETLPSPPPTGHGHGGDIILRPGPAQGQKINAATSVTGSSHLNVVGLDVLTGAPVLRVDVPDSVFSGQGTTCQGFVLTSAVGASQHGPLTLTAGGAITLEYMQTMATDTADPSTCNRSSSVSLTLNLLTVDARGQSTTQLLLSSGGSSSLGFGPFSDPSIAEIEKNDIFPMPFPSGITPDGEGGLLAQWASIQGGADSECIVHIFQPPDCTFVPQEVKANLTALGAQGGEDTLTLPLSGWDVAGDFLLANSSSIERVVLSDNGTAIAHNGNQIVGFDIHTRGITFQYSRVLNIPGAPAGRLTPALLQAARENGGAAAILFAENGPEVALLDSSGNAGFPAVGRYSAIAYAGGNQFYGFFPPDAPDLVFLVTVPEMEPADSQWPEFQSDNGKQRDSNPITIDSISPTLGVVGAATQVTILGRGFGSNPVIDAGKAILADIVSHSDSEIIANFTPSPVGGVGKQNIAIADKGRKSNPRDFFGQVPASLKVLSVIVLPDGPSAPSGCPAQRPYGINVDITYQVLDQQIPPQPIQSAQMIPHEEGVFFTGGDFDNNIGPVKGFPTSSRNTAPNGMFHDVPLGACSPFPISNPGQTAIQNITIILPSGVSFPVRSQTLTVAAPGVASFEHGTLINNITAAGSGSDISARR